jgi:hypothetical protein
MTKRIKVTTEVISYLKESSSAAVSHKEMSAHLGCCVDTVKRLLSRYEIERFDGAKYAFPPETKMWIRPCLSCKNDDPRPKNLYFCNTCRPNYGGLPDQWDDF